VTSDL